MEKKNFTRKTKKDIKILKDSIRPYSNTSDYAGEQIKKLNEISVTINKRNAQLEKMLSTEDRAICDLEHYLEFSEGLDMYKSWLVMKNLKTRLQKRRDIKREMKVLNAIFTNSISTKGMNNINKIGNAIETSGYVPRELPELFES